jgi:hypothetical protein
MTISCRPPEAVSDPTSERPAPDRNRVPSVCAILSPAHPPICALGCRRRRWPCSRFAATCSVRSLSPQTATRRDLPAPYPPACRGGHRAPTRRRSRHRPAEFRLVQHRGLLQPASPPLHSRHASPARYEQTQTRATYGRFTEATTQTTRFVRKRGQGASVTTAPACRWRASLPPYPPHRRALSDEALANPMPERKTLDAWDESAPAIPKQTQRALRALEWIDRAEAL